MYQHIMMRALQSYLPLRRLEAMENNGADLAWLVDEMVLVRLAQGSGFVDRQWSPGRLYAS